MTELGCSGEPNWYANPVTHLDLQLEVNFEAHVLKGYVDLTVNRLDNKADLILETKDLTIHNVRNKNNLNEIAFELIEVSENSESILLIKLPKQRSEKVECVRIEYETSPKARALQWLDPPQTVGKTHPYMFSQCQDTNACSVVPCQDTLNVKSTYTATIKVPKQLTVLMSAISEGADEDGPSKIFKFHQNVSIPSFLLTIVVGKLESRQIGPRSYVWSEKEIVDKAAEEFADTEKMISIAEKILGEYVWEIYNLLVMPSCIPFGGISNPCLSFVNPALLAGDKSLVNVIAHEISHCWMFNLVTKGSSEQLWLDEGFTVYMERRILAHLYGESRRQFEALGGWKDLEYTVETEKPEFTKLVVDLKDVDPEDAFNFVAYEKGHTLLYYLETVLGGPEVFEKFFKSYVQEFQKQAVDTDIWKAYLYKYFSDKEDILNKVDWDTWFYASGMPPVKPDYDCSLLKKCTDLSDAWIKASEDNLSEFSTDDTASMSSPQIKEFLACLLQEKPLSIKKLGKMNELYKIGEISNTEIKLRWLRLGLRAQWKAVLADALMFVNEQGRLKYVRPIYRDLYCWGEVREEVIANFKAHKSEMMYATAYGIQKDLHLLDDKSEDESE